MAGDKAATETLRNKRQEFVAAMTEEEALKDLESDKARRYFIKHPEELAAALSAA